MLLASKQDELDDRIPLIREIQKLARYEFPYKDCKAEEEILLKELDWKLSVITPLHILQSLLGMGILFENDKVHLTDKDSHSEIDDHVLRRVRRSAEHMCDLAVKTSWLFQTYFPSTVAVACLVSSRMANQI